MGDRTHRSGEGQAEVARVPRNIELEMIAPLGVYAEVTVTHVDTVNRMYLRWESGLIATNISVTPFDLKTETLVVEKDLKVDGYCLVAYAGDAWNEDGMYRGCILKRCKANYAAICTILLVDIGVEVEVPHEKVYKLLDKYKDQRRMCFKFGILDYVQVKTEEAVSLAQHYIYEKFRHNRMLIRVESSIKSDLRERTSLYGNMCPLDDKSDDDLGPNTMYQDLLQLGCVLEYQRRNFSELERGLIVGTLVRNIKVNDFERLRMATSEKVWICPGIKTLNDFYVISSSKMPIIQELEEMLARMDTIGLDPYLPWEKNAGDWCLIRSENEMNWLRAKVIYIAGRTAKIQLLDYGGVTVADLKSLRGMPDFARDIPALGIRCTLPISAVSPQFNPKIIDNMYNLNHVPVDIIAHLIQYLEDNRFEIDIEIRPLENPSHSFSFCEKLVNEKEATWNNVDYVAYQLHKSIMASYDDSTESETTLTSIDTHVDDVDEDTMDEYQEEEAT